jgi:very-short-patch-repair endonuclease
VGDLRDLESILKALHVRGMHQEPLRWHYRSRHEDLIAFSNYEIYHGNLITFPTAETEAGATRGVQLDYVADGRYEVEQDRLLKTPMRVNRIEAKRVARLVMNHARTRPHESLAVVALNINQRDVIEEEVKQLRQLDASVDEFFVGTKSEHFFVKALEEVQGDERDVMIISIGYGKNAKGELSHNFGPINRDGGYRRLNVLVTRAKYQVIVVSSIRAGDIDLTRTSSLGPRLLRSYLDFAERGRIALEAETVGGDGDYDSPFEEEVGEALSRAGYTVRRQIGSSRFRIDLGIVDPEQPGRYLLGIECDGATYHSSKTARDRDRLRQDILEGLGWTIHRIWSTDWMRSPDREVQRVIDHLEEIRRQPRDVPDPIDIDTVIGIAVPDEPGLLHITHAEVMSEPIVELAAEYRVAQLEAFANGDILNVGLGVLNRVVKECIAAEGPIHGDLLARRVTNAWGLQRTGTRIAERIKLSLRDLETNRHIERNGAFWALTGAADVVVGGPSSDGWVREVKYISDEEISRAFARILEQAFSLSDDELIQQTARLFGFSRTGGDINRRFQIVTEQSVTQGTLARKGGRIELTKP